MSLLIIFLQTDNAKVEILLNYIGQSFVQRFEIKFVKDNIILRDRTYFSTFIEFVSFP